MPEGKFCNKKTINTDEDLKALLADTTGRTYYEEMKCLDVDKKLLWESIKKTCKSRTRTWLDICARCGLCAESCFIYLCNDRDPTQSPAYKMHSTLGEMIRRKGKVDNDFMHMTMETAWAKCTCCNRCGQYCPHGIDVGVVMSYVRGLLFEQGFVPWELKIGSGMHRVYRAQMDVSNEDWVDTCKWMEEEQQDDWPGLEIPVDKENADILFCSNAREPKYYPEDIAATAILFHIAGENWTVPSKGWDMTSLTLFAGDWEGCKMQIADVYASMERLMPKRMVATECGHAFRATVIEGPYWMGRKDGTTPVPSIHYVEWVAEALRTDKLKIDPDKRLKIPTTYQDACNYIRNGGLALRGREIMRQIVAPGYFIEMDPDKEHNYCCGGGGGLNGLGIYRTQRNIGLQTKLQQIKDSGAKMVISPCHNCWDAIRDMSKEYNLDIKWSLIKHVLPQMLIIPEHLRQGQPT